MTDIAAVQTTTDYVVWLTPASIGIALPDAGKLSPRLLNGRRL